MRKRGIEVDKEGLNVEMERKKEEERENWNGYGEDEKEKIWLGIKDKVGEKEFMGYEKERDEGVIEQIVSDGVEVKYVREGEKIQVVVNKKKLYGE